MPKLRKFLKALLTPVKFKRSPTGNPLLDTWEREHAHKFDAGAGSASKPPKPAPKETEIFYDPNPYNFFLLCPDHAEPGFVQEIYDDEMAHLLYLYNGKLHPGLSPGVARDELARRTTLTTDMKSKIQRRMEELDVSRNALMDPKQRAIVDERYGGRTKCQVCAEPLDMTIADPEQYSASGLMTHPRPFSREWKAKRAQMEEERYYS
ncbi:hypothetical protein TWF506_001627 [Arthrobotrys conoides]|uniref:Uncharacterized protein n=1 Tax=Arthrobotrys conoides TaxID=74498 RepID=A0AAN8NGP4_9PEZI